MSATQAAPPTLAAPVSPPTLAAPVSDEPHGAYDAELMPHAYDGIREYDNPLPGWWKWGFYACIAFAAVYGVYYHVLHKGKMPDEIYKTELAAYAMHAQMRAPSGPNVNEGLLANGVNDDSVMQHGAAVFAAKCVGCHTADGRGQIGPNLTDEFQIHGSTRMDIYDTINRGVPGTAMPAWGEQLSGQDVMAAAVFVSSLRGKNLPGKAAEGKPVGKFL